MTTAPTAGSAARRPADGNGWYGVSLAEVATRFGVDPADGLTSQQAPRPVVALAEKSSAAGARAVHTAVA
jgi:hypothetical protein